MNENKKIVTVGELREFIKVLKIFQTIRKFLFVVRDIAITIFKMKECIKTVIQM